MSTATLTRRTTHQQKREPVPVGTFHLVWLFFLCSLVGLVGETLVSYLVDGRWESRAGFVLEPLSPIYGTGAVLMTLFVNPLRGKPPIVQFLTAALVGGTFEYFAGWLFETRYGIVAWSYADQPFNLHGHTCLGIALVWGALGTLWVLWVLPRAVRFVERIPQGARRPLTWCLGLLLFADAVLTLTCLDCWFLRSAGFPPEGIVQQFCNAYFGDDFMRTRFETMSLWPVLASR